MLRFSLLEKPQELTRHGVHMEINDNDARTDNMEKTLANALQHITRRTKSSRNRSVSGVELAKLKTRKTKSTVDFYKLSERKQNYAGKSDIM